jgi:hypothetical protein
LKRCIWRSRCRLIPVHQIREDHCTRHNQHVTAKRRRLLHLRRATSVLAILKAA